MTDSVYAIDLVRQVIDNLTVATRDTISRDFAYAIETHQMDGKKVIGVGESLHYRLITLLESGEIEIVPAHGNIPTVYVWKGV